jgi:hypothetical protein
VFEAVKVWPGKGEACRKVGVTANLVQILRASTSGMRRSGRRNGLGENKKPTKQSFTALANSLTTKTPYKGLGADSEEKHEPASDIDTAPADSLKALDPKRPIREAEVSPNRAK